MGNKVYLLTAGCYSDYHVVCACSTREKAEALKKVINERGGDCGDDVEIEEYGLDLISGHDVERTTRAVVFYNDGDRIVRLNSGLYETSVPNTTRAANPDMQVIECHTRPSCPGSMPKYAVYVVYVFAETEEEALKKASDRLAAYKAEKEGIS